MTLLLEFAVLVNFILEEDDSLGRHPHLKECPHGHGYGCSSITWLPAPLHLSTLPPSVVSITNPATSIMVVACKNHRVD